MLLAFERDSLDELFNALKRRGYDLIAPTVQDEVIVYDQIQGVDQLPQGWTDEQEGGAYRLRRRGDQALFGYAVGPHSWKKYLHPPILKLLSAKKEGKSLKFVDEDSSEVALTAFIGVRPCEVHAILIQDRVFLGGSYRDPYYEKRRDNSFIVAVNCGNPAQTCFCTSMDTGPQATSGYDLALTEIIHKERHFFLADVQAPLAFELFGEVPHHKASEEECGLAEEEVQRARSKMHRSMDTNEIKELLYRNLEHSRWDEVASRCLSCGNCTMVCPTCFCTRVEDVSDLRNETAERIRSWDSCFNLDFSYIHGGSVRRSTRSRYRQWMTHKLATWIDQFDSSGCVGCGRCITWCPVGIDITEEVQVIRDSDLGKAGD